MSKPNIAKIADRFTLRMKEPVLHPNPIRQLLAARKTLLIALAEIDHYGTTKRAVDASELRSQIQKTIQILDQLIQDQVESPR